MKHAAISRRGAFTALIGAAGPAIATIPASVPKVCVTDKDAPTLDVMLATIRKLMIDQPCDIGEMMDALKVYYTANNGEASRRLEEGQIKLAAWEVELEKQFVEVEPAPIVLDPKNDLTEENIEDVTSCIYRNERGGFGVNLLSAREVYRYSPKLVLAEDFPAEFVEDIRGYMGDEEMIVTENTDAVAFASREQCRERAIECLKARRETELKKQ